MTNKSKSITEYFKKYSFLKFAGINSLILIDVYSSIVKFVCIKNKEPFYKIKSEKLFHNIKVIASEFHPINENLDLIKPLLKKFVEKNNLQNSYAAIGINDFKFNLVTLPNDADDIQQWFGENSNKFLPEGRPAGEFQYSYEQYYEDENSKYFYVVVARSNLISRIYDECNLDSIKLINISPFSLSFNSLTRSSERNTLFLDFTNGRLIYTLINYSGNIYNGEYYFGNGDPSQFEFTLISNSLEEFYSSLAVSVNEKSLENPEVYICCKKENLLSLKEIISRIFRPQTINTGYENFDSFYTGSYLMFNRLACEFDSQVNLLNKSRIAEERFLIEKQIGMRTVLAGGLVLIILLLFGYLIENFITTQLNNEQETILKTNMKTARVEELKKENERLTNNLSLLHSLKDKKNKFSPLLFGFTRMVIEKSCLISVSIKSNDKALTDLEITGLADSQQEITEIISFMEKSSKFKDVSLVYASSKKQNEIKLVGISSSSLMNFKISAKYYADKE